MLYNAGTTMVAYFDQYYSTIRHVHCHKTLPGNSRSTRCGPCRAYRHVLRSSLDRLQKNQEPDSLALRCDPPEKFERLQNMHKLIRKQSKQIAQLQKSLDKFIQTNGILVNDNLNQDLLNIMNTHTSAVLTAEDQFKSLFWQQQMKASLCKSKNGVRWNPAIIR